jgi:ABC-type uncharacterized transport system substrate-binding protein
MHRRDFIMLVGGAAVWPLTARAQQRLMPVVGFLNSASPKGYQIAQTAFIQGLKESGYIEGRNVAIEYRWAEGHYDRLPGLAADLIRHQVNVIVANTAALVPAMAATKTIPIVFVTSFDPVKRGVVASLSRPGGNVTGVTSLNVAVGSKRLELLHEVIPTATKVALLLNPNNPNAEAFLKASQAAAGRLGLQLHVLRASTERDIDLRFKQLIELQTSALVIGPDAFYNSRREQLGALTLRYTVPAIYESRAFAAAGGLMSYGGNLVEPYRLSGVYVARILKGEKASDLPVQQATKVELIINMKTAKALHLAIPLPVIGRADEVIE